MKKNIIGIIPARGGSKRLPGKNTKLLNGKPLVAYTIEAGLKSRYLDRVFVSTEDREIADVSEKWGAEIIKRPEILATDTTKTIDVIIHSLAVLAKEKYYPDIVVILQPTSPLRMAEDIDKAISIFLKHESGSVISVFEAPSYLWWALINKKQFLEPVFNWKKFSLRSQNLPKIFVPNGAIYILASKTILKKKTTYLKGKTLPYIMPFERSIDIDYEEDFKLAESILKKKP